MIASGRTPAPFVVPLRPHRLLRVFLPASFPGYRFVPTARVVVVRPVVGVVDVRVIIVGHSARLITAVPTTLVVSLNLRRGVSRECSLPVLPPMRNLVVHAATAPPLVALNAPPALSAALDPPLALKSCPCALVLLFSSRVPVVVLLPACPG